jgi:1,2-diacylglycerol 3-alpha-glucosyltransferase
MRIVVSSDVYPPVVSGVATVVDKQSRALANSGHKTTVIAPGTPAFTAIHRSKNLDHFAVRQWRNLLRRNSSLGFVSTLRLRLLFQELTPDLIHIHSSGTVGYATLWAGKKLGIPMVGTLHGVPQFLTAYAPWLTKKTKRITLRILWSIIKHFYNQMDVVTVPSHFAATEMIAHGIKRPIIIHPMWIEPIAKSKQNATAINGKHIPKDVHVFLYFGRIDPDKNLHLVIDAARLLKQHHKDFRIVFAGKGSLSKTLQTLARKKHVDDVCIWTGYIKDTDKPLIYARANTFIMPSPVETQSLTTLQAIQQGIPVIMANAGALPEIAQRFPHQSTLFSHSDSHELAEKMKNMIGKQSKKYTANAFDTYYGKIQYIRHLEEIYRQALIKRTKKY